MNRQPARKITNHGREIVTGGFSSIKNNCSIRWEAQNERDFLYHLEFDPEVIRYASQPLKLHYNLDGTMLTHYPDFAVERRNGRIDYYEVKPFDKTAELSFQDKTKAIRERLNKMGHQYYVVTDREIKIEPRLSNLKILYRYLATKHSLADQQAVMNCLVQPMKLNDLKYEIEILGLSISVCYWLMATGKIKFDLNEPITLRMTVYRA